MNGDENMDGKRSILEKIGAVGVIIIFLCMSFLVFSYFKSQKPDEVISRVGNYCEVTGGVYGQEYVPNVSGVIEYCERKDMYCEAWEWYTSQGSRCYRYRLKK